MVQSSLKWHGGKSRLATRLVSLTPKTIITRTEPYGGALWYMLASDPNGVSEIVNDMSLELSNFWWVLRDEDSFIRMSEYLYSTPFSELEYKSATTKVGPTPDWHAAAEFFIRCRQSRAGSFNSFAPITKNRLRRGMNEQVSAWWSAIASLEAVHDRLARILILCRPAIEIIRTLDAIGSHFYLDPPYIEDVRVSTEVYQHEMTREDHEAMLDLVTSNGMRSTFMISGKRCELYDGKLKGWNRVEFDMPLDTASGTSKRRVTECVWMNYDPPKDALELHRESMRVELAG